jgi:cyclohexanone monooxygenase
MAARKRPTVAILGAGAGGIAMAVRLVEAGYGPGDLTIYERGDGVGGTWRHNTYPGAECDVPSHLYSFSFQPNPAWSKTYASQPEILAYLEQVAATRGVLPHVRTRTPITEARWLQGRWELTSDAGEQFHCDVLISGLGMLNVPAVPEIPGAERFAGRQFHSSAWDHSSPLAGERVASIGTGASAVQYVPVIAREVEHLTVFQRTPIWVSPRFDNPYPEETLRRFSKVPLAARRHRWQIWWTYQRASFEAGSQQTAQQTELARSYLERKVADPDLRAKLTPDYPVGCKRPLTSREWFPALCRENVSVVTDPIVEITESGIRTADGTVHEVDSIVYGTGFRASEYLSGIEIFGRDGRRLHDDWADGAEAYLGTTVAGYPNLFLLYGPNTNGVNSILFIHEAQVHLIMRALRAMSRLGLAELEVRRRVMDRYNRRLQARMAGTVWLAGCHSYYTAPSGKVVTQLPRSGGWFWLRTRVLPLTSYRIRRHRALT